MGKGRKVEEERIYKIAFWNVAELRFGILEGDKGMGHNDVE